MALKRCTSTEHLWNRNLASVASPVLSEIFLPRSDRSWRADVLCWGRPKSQRRSAQRCNGLQDQRTSLPTPSTISTGMEVACGQGNGHSRGHMMVIIISYRLTASIDSGKCNATVWCLSICLSVCLSVGILTHQYVAWAHVLPYTVKIYVYPPMSVASFPYFNWTGSAYVCIGKSAE